MFTGFRARIQSANGNKLSFPAAALYKYALNNTAILHDVSSGNNIGFTAKAGWDYASGFGSLNMGNFAAFVATYPDF